MFIFCNEIVFEIFDTLKLIKSNLIICVNENFMFLFVVRRHFVKFSNDLNFFNYVIQNCRNFRFLTLRYREKK